MSCDKQKQNKIMDRFDVRKKKFFCFFLAFFLLFFFYLREVKTPAVNFAVPSRKGDSKPQTVKQSKATFSVRGNFAPALSPYAGENAMRASLHLKIERISL